MKKISTVIISTVLAIAAGQAAAQANNAAAAHAAASATAQAAANKAVTPAPGKMPSVMVPVIKNFKAAQSLELDRAKFHAGAIEKFRKCVSVAKVNDDIPACQAEYRTALADNVRDLAQQGKFDAAYDVQPTVVKPSPAPAKK